MKPLGAAVVFLVVHLRAVAVLVRALRRFVGITLTYLLVLLLLFDAGFKNTHTQLVST